MCKAACPSLELIVALRMTEQLADLVLDIDVEPELLVCSPQGICQPPHRRLDPQVTVILHCMWLSHQGSPCFIVG